MKFKVRLTIVVLILFINTSSAESVQYTRLSSVSARCQKINNENICTYSGNAKFNRGATSLQAQQITIHEVVDGKIDKIVASGEHSHYSTVTDNNKKPVNADANLITIYPNKNLMILKEKGEIIVGQDKYSGPHIEYKF